MTLTNELAEGLKISWEAIRANKMRSVLTTLGIIIGIATVSLMASAIHGLDTAFRKSISMLGSDVLFIQRFPWGPEQEWWQMRNRPEITMADARLVAREAKLARAVSVEAGGMETVRYEDRTARGVFTIGNNADSALVRGLVIQTGRFFSEAEVAGARPVCVLGAALAENLFPHVPAVGKKVRVGSGHLEVIGVIDKMGEFLFANLDNQLIMPITRYTTDFSRRPDLMIAVKVVSIERLEDAKAELRGIMRKARRLAPGAEDNFAINQQDMILNMFKRVGGTLATAGLFITGLSLLVGGIGIMNIMFVSVVERTQEIGLRKALGAKRRTILIQFLTEASILCLMGGLLGLAIAYGLTWGIRQFLPTQMSVSVVGIALLVSVVTGLLSGYFPASRAAGMKPVDALRQE
jgi:putative ABC transport system permease protein